MSTNQNPDHARLLDEVASLRTEVELLRAALATEVRTRRLVVVDPDGREAFTVFADVGVAELALSAGSDDDAPVVLLTASYELSETGTATVTAATAGREESVRCGR
jgi:hypothetical protein